MQFQVPQFLETETKIIGPFTLKQFMWLGAGGALIFLMNFVLPTGWFLVISIPIAVLAIALAFAKIDGMPLFNYFMHALNFTVGTKQYLFKKDAQSQQLPDQTIDINNLPKLKD